MFSILQRENAEKRETKKLIEIEKKKSQCIVNNVSFLIMLAFPKVITNLVFADV